MNEYILIISAFCLLWFGSGLSINAVEKLSRSLKIPSFLISFYALGLLTSTSEISVGVFSILDRTPSVSVGNLLGASVVLTLFVIPLLAVLNNGIRFSQKSEPINLPLCYLVISLPTFLLLDRRLSLTDGFLMLVAYIFLSISVSTRASILEKLEASLRRPKIQTFNEILKAAVGILCVIVASKIIVDQVVSFSSEQGISPFLLGLVVLSIGTNLPEISILIRSFFLNKRDVALGDYIGSASLNTFLLSLLVFFSPGGIALNSGIKPNLILLPLGSLLFLYFVRNHKLERYEGFFLLALYFAFVVSEFLPL